MKALYKDINGVSYTDIEKPVIKNSNDVIIKIKMAALCRTDIYVAENIVESKDKLVLGHEFSGVVDSVGNHVNGLKSGDHVTVMPVIACGECEFCLKGKSDICPHTTMLGIDSNGAFAEYISVPASSVHKLPANVSFKLGAYSEPMAASLSILKAGIKPQDKGLIYGNNRFADLIARILRYKGFTNITVYNPDLGEELPANNFDFAIETSATEDIMQQIFKALKPQGKLILKSRKYENVGINFQQAVMKELQLIAVNYASFKDVLELFADDDFNIDDLLGEVFSLNDFEMVFAYAKRNESKKIFFEIG